MPRIMPITRRSNAPPSIAARLLLPRVAAKAGEARRRAVAPALTAPRRTSGRNNRRRPPSAIANPGRLDLNVPAPDPNVAVEGLRLIIKKNLTATDVGPLKRIVLPKNSAEVHMPVLIGKEGMKLRMHDIETFQLWEFKYKFWPNNRGKMYVLENTGHYVDTHNLQVGDSVLIYKDDAKGHLIIRSKKRDAEEENNAPQLFDGIFDSILQDFKVSGPRYSDIFTSCEGSIETNFDLAFQPLPFSDEGASTSGSSSPALDWSPSSSHL